MANDLEVKTTEDEAVAVVVVAPVRMTVVVGGVPAPLPLLPLH